MRFLITPNIFNKFFDFSIKSISFLCVVSFFISGYLILNSPPDYQQGEYVKIMYVHVPSAWLSLGVYISISVSAFSYLVWKNPLSAVFMQSAIPIGACFCFICLITGMLWGKPIWGAYWVWDARLTSVLILLFLYLGLYFLSQSFENKETAYKRTAILALIGVINLPIIRFSVKWWNSLHQPASIMRLEKPAIHIDILMPLISVFISFMLLFLVLLMLKVKTHILESKLDRVKSY